MLELWHNFQLQFAVRGLHFLSFEAVIADAISNFKWREQFFIYKI